MIIDSKTSIKLCISNWSNSIFLSLCHTVERNVDCFQTVKDMRQKVDFTKIIIYVYCFATLVLSAGSSRDAIGPDLAAKSKKKINPLINLLPLFRPKSDD